MEVSECHCSGQISDGADMPSRHPSLNQKNSPFQDRYQALSFSETQKYRNQIIGENLILDTQLSLLPIGHLGSIITRKEHFETTLKFYTEKFQENYTRKHVSCWLQFNKNAFQ